MNKFHERNRSSLGGLYHKCAKGKDKFFLLSQHSHIWANARPNYAKCPTNMCLVFMTPIGYSSVEYIPKELRENLYSNEQGLHAFRDNPTQFLLKKNKVINYCNIIEPDHNYLDCIITLKPYAHEHKNQLGLYSLPLHKGSIDMLQNKSLPGYLKVNGEDKKKKKEVNPYGKDVNLSKLLTNKILFPKDPSIDLNIIFIDTCRVLWARLPGISYKNEYISFKKAIYHNINPETVEVEKGRFFTLKNKIKSTQTEDQYILQVLNEVSNYKKFEIERTKKFLKTFITPAHNNKTNQLLNRYSITAQNSNLKALINHIKSFNKTINNINNFFNLRNANKQNVNNLKRFYKDGNDRAAVNAALGEAINEIVAEVEI